MIKNLITDIAIFLFILIAFILAFLLVHDYSMNFLFLQNLAMGSCLLSSLVILITILLFRLGLLPAFYKGVEHGSNIEYGKITILLLVIMVALLGIIAITIINYSSPHKYELSDRSLNLVYQLTVQDTTNRHTIQDAQILIEVNGREYVTDLTDSNGLSLIVVSSELSGQSAQLIVKANGYNIYTQKVTLIENGLPSLVLLEAKA